MTEFRKFLVIPVAAAAALTLASCHGTAPMFSVSGSVSGSTVGSVVKLNGVNDISMSGDGNFKFTGLLLQDDTYNVQIVDPGDRCTVSGGAGTIAMSDITGVSINCVAQDAQNITQSLIRSANLSGAQVNQPVTTMATGAGGIVLAPASLSITGGFTFSGLAPVAVELRQAPTGNAGGNGSRLIQLVLGADSLSAYIPPTTLTLSQLASLLAGELYFNVTTAANPAGEIRGAINLQGGVGASLARLDGSQVSPQPTASAATGSGTLLVDQATGNILVAYITHDVTGPTAAALHTSAPPSTTGLSIVPFANFLTNIDGLGTNLVHPASTANMNQNLTDFTNSLLYFEIDTAANPSGEIRGNVSPL
jgi:hypothetical protein